MSADELLAGLRERGYQARMVSIDRVGLLQKQLGGLREKGLFDEVFFQERLGWFRFQASENLPNARSIVVAAIPRPQTRATFTFDGHKRSLIVPPTYTACDQVKKQFENVVAEILGGKGLSVARTELPLKQLAVRSGLAEYGKNNICYVNGMGSFLQIVAAYSDLQCAEDSWREPVMMKSCDGCDLCRRACPTGAISADRFLLHGERCIVYHNEKKGDVPFPNWMAASWHNCLIGCMHCQRACPLNKEFLDWVEGEEEFSEEETALLMKGLSQDKMPTKILEKIERLSLTDDIDKFPRNLNVFFKKTNKTS
ncbi:MAG TPA: 4Fe-4S double cluster binding domain-containing protein [Candidatus Bathyarchaeia archaeon]|nr:4Fe-4S double cluster binding domain-containing protein [Candidatus Bathyarchaeia archaeon]